MNRPLARAALAVIAVVAIAWLAVLFRDSLLIAQGKKIVFNPHATPAQARHGLTIVEQAHLLNPDRAVIQGSIAAMYVRQGRSLAAVREYERLVSAEPDFADAWDLLAVNAARFDPSLAAHAVAMLRRLDPLYPR